MHLNPDNLLVSLNNLWRGSVHLSLCWQLVFILRSVILKLPVEEDYDLSDVELDDFKDELWVQMGQDWSRLSAFGLVWSGPVRSTSPLLWTNGRPGRPVTEILLKRHMRDTCGFSHHLVSHKEDRKEGRVCRVLWVNSFSHTCWTLDAAYLKQLPPTEERRVELPNVTFLSLFHFLKHCLSCPRQAPTLRCGLVKLTLKRPTWCD